MYMLGPFGRQLWGTAARDPSTFSNLIYYTPFVQPAGCLFTRYHRLYNRLSNRLDNQLHRLNKHSTGCRTGTGTGSSTRLF